LKRWYIFHDEGLAKQFTAQVQKQCEVCQVSEASRGSYKCHITPMPMPPYLMDSVAVVLFTLPEVNFEGHHTTPWLFV